MIVFAANKSIMRLKLKKGIIRQFQPHDRFVSCNDEHEIMHRWLIIRAKNEPQVQLTKFK